MSLEFKLYKFLWFVAEEEVKIDRTRQRLALNAGYSLNYLFERIGGRNKIITADNLHNFCKNFKVSDNNSITKEMCKRVIKTYGDDNLGIDYH